MARPPKKKAAIERAALELFAEVGIDAASIRMIAERAEVTEGALYRHHKGKDDLVLALFHRYFESIGERLREAAATGSTLEARIPAMVAAFLATHDEDPKAFQFVMIVQHKLLEKVRASEDNNPVEVLQGVLRQATESGELPADAPVALLTQMLLGSVMQVAVGARYGRVEKPLAPLAPVVAGRCLGLLRG